MSLTINDLFIGQVASMQRTFNESDVKLCNELTKDYSPIYEVNNEAWKSNFDKPVVPGLLTEGLITQVISEKLPGSACILLQKELVFCHPVHIGDMISAELEVIDINLDRDWVTQKVTCFNQAGIEVIKGQVVIFVLSNQGIR
ncbi:MaoC/PaaZ C-terminal domain-containing protein [Peribacillus simplex]|uniref:MaoC/PaaZ C-terminal domain-containing protein n=1 Tax=Peribacillus simplex TaxID=1478 RepID=UPI003339C4E5